VFRASMTETEGRMLTISSVGGTEVVKLSLPVKDAWNVANMAAVAFVTDEAGVEQVVEKEIL